MNNIRLESKMGESLVGFSHFVRIFFFLHCSTFAFGSGNDFSSQFFVHGFFTTSACIANQPFHAQGYFTLRTNFGRDLEVCTTYTAGFYFYSRHYIVQRFFPDRKSTRLNSSHVRISYAVFCLKKKNYNLTFMKKPTLLYLTLAIAGILHSCFVGIRRTEPPDPNITEIASRFNSAVITTKRRAI